MNIPSWKAIAISAVVALPFLGVAGVASAGSAMASGDQHAVDYGNGYAQVIETDTGNEVGPTYKITSDQPNGEVASSATYRAPQGGTPANPAPSGQVAPGVEGMIVDAAGRYGLDATRMLRVARCESGLNPNAIGDGGFSHGVFQFQMPLWSSTPQGQAGANRLNGPANIEAAAWVMSRTGYGPWSCK